MNDNRNLLVEVRTLNISKDMIMESIRKNQGELIVQGIITQRNEHKNQNGRIYPREILEREVEKYNMNFVKQNRALGELDHPESSVVNLKNVSHSIMELLWEGDNLIGKIKILTTPSGNIAKELFKCGVQVGISSRALGSVKKIDENTVEVQEDLEIVAWDLVSNPSVACAVIKPITPLTEGVAPQTILTPKYKNVEKIIRDILMEIK